MAARLKQLLRLTPTLSPSFLGRNSKISSHVLCGCTQADTFITRNQSKADSRFFITHAVADDSIELGPSATHLMRSSLLHQRRCSFTISKRNDHRISRAFTSGSCDQKTDFADIKLMMKHKLEEKKSSSEEVKKQLGLLDILFEHRLQQLDASAVREEADKFDPALLYELASDIFSLQEKVGQEAAILSGPLFRHAANSGDLNAKYSYAQLMRLGQAGFGPDPVEAAAIFSELAKKGHPYAQFALAGMYYAGTGVEQNLQTAYTLFQIAAENGVIQGYNMIGKMYFQGETVESDFKKAFEYFKKGADKGDIGAFMSVAHCYANGKGVDVDHNKAFEYHKMAADKGHVPALYNMGSHYFAGKGIELDMKKAGEFFKRAADLGFGLAQVNLGNMFYHGLGVEKDWNAARLLYKKAAPSNHNARLLLEELETEMKKDGMELKD